MYASYKSWCEQAGERPNSQKKLGMLLDEKGFQREKKERSLPYRYWYISKQILWTIGPISGTFGPFSSLNKKLKMVISLWGNDKIGPIGPIGLEDTKKKSLLMTGAQNDLRKR